MPGLDGVMALKFIYGEHSKMRPDVLEAWLCSYFGNMGFVCASLSRELLQHEKCLGIISCYSFICVIGPQSQQFGFLTVTSAKHSYKIFWNKFEETLLMGCKSDAVERSMFEISISTCHL
jgi:hypothetical protein